MNDETKAIREHLKLINDDIADLALFVSRNCELNETCETYLKAFAKHATNRNKTLGTLGTLGAKKGFGFSNE